MSINFDGLEEIRKKSAGYWSNRIISQLEYAIKLSEVNGGKFDGLIETVIAYIRERFLQDDTVTRETAVEAEKKLAVLEQDAKRYKVVCAAHAHIDMNWMWGYAETVAITLDTFRTMLNIMEEYPDYKFSQSQASVYKIVEEYDPDMLGEIKKRIKEGRWEVTASTWVETDKNMPTGESLSRHILYTKRYLSKLLDIKPETLNLDFEPDTFGHSQNVPEILCSGGIKYYYFCRGYEGHYLFRWKAPSGNSVLVYREPHWYISAINSSLALCVPEFCSKHGIDTMLKVYGVGDHGGGPTRRDVEKIIDMSSWPVFPDIRFGTFSEFFEIADKVKDSLPVVEGELNFIFTGCYTSQSRIKLANRISEAKLNEAEAYGTISSLFAGGRYFGERLGKAWERVLFGHFHDILPGSGVIDTREYAMGEFQKVLAEANTRISMASRKIASHINTASLVPVEEKIDESVSEGAGAGFGIADFAIPQAERGKGKKRIYHLFNPSARERHETVKIIVWDWPGDKSRIVIKDSNGNEARHQLIASNTDRQQDRRYWGHMYFELLLEARVPAYGYNTYILDEKELSGIKAEYNLSPRVHKPDEFVLENKYIKAVFDTKDAKILSLTDKASGKDLIDANKPAGIFRLIREDDSRGMTSWIVGRYMDIIDLNQKVKIRGSHMNADSLRQWIEYGVEFGNSSLSVTVSLDKDSSRLDFNVVCDWQERPQKGQFIPQLNFYLPVAYKCKTYKYDIPFGVIERDAMDMDVPANSWVCGAPDNPSNPAVMLVSSSKYGFRGLDDSMSITLIRSSYDPDPYPELGMHKFRFSVNIVDCGLNTELISKAYNYNHPISFISGTRHDGTMPAINGFLSLEEGNVAISAVKMPEDFSPGKVILRMYETEGRSTKAVLRFAQKIKRAELLDINENVIDGGETHIHVNGERVEIDISAHKVVTCCIEF